MTQSIDWWTILSGGFVSYPDAEVPKAPKVSNGGLMEDVIKIFYQPTAVFDNQRNNSFVMPALIQTLLFAVIVFSMKNLISPFWDAESARAMAAQAAKMAASGQAMPEGAKAMSEKIASVTAMIGPLIAPWLTAIIGGLITWIAAKIVGAKLSYGQAATITSWAAFPAVLAFITTAIFGMMMDPQTIRGVTDGQLGPGKFIDPNTTSRALVALFQQMDIFSVWTFILSGIGIAVVSRASLQTGLVGAAIKWGIIVCFSVLPAVLM
ncbi:MAG: YIP1 family protein [Gemmatimonadaceae bacterium]